MTKLTNRVISIFDRKTSMRLANPEWLAIDDICHREHIKRKKLFELIAANKDPKIGFTCSVRLFAITYMHSLISEQNLYKSSQLKTVNSDFSNILNTIHLMS